MSATLRIVRSPAIRIVNHEMHIDRQIGDLADALDNRFANGQIRDKVVVHHIDVNHVRIRNALEIAFEIAEIRR